MRRALIPTLIAIAVLLVPANMASATTSASAHTKLTAARSYTGPCHDAVRAYWPAAWQGWAHAIVHRESRGLPSAANARSSARGCFQMLLRYSAPFYRAVGCSNYQWNNATCNVRAALVMRTRHGVWPWKMPTRRR